MVRGDHIARLNDLKAWFTVRGTGPTCLFPTPGWGASSDLYFETLRPLERWFTVVYVDTRGSGRSARALPDDAYRIDRFTSDLDELRRLLGQDAVWVMGHSLGGLLAQYFAIHYPGSCRGLILLDSTAAIDEAGAIDTDVRARRRSREPWFAEAYATLHREDDIASDAEFKDHFKAILPFYYHDVSKLTASDFANETFSVEAYTMMSVNSETFGRGVLHRLGELDLPAVIVVGDDDFICSPTQAMRIHLPLRNSKLVLVERAGHFPWLEQPDAFYSGLEAALRQLGAISTLEASDQGRLDPNAPSA
jgi:proline iminopeptidase